MLLKLKRFTAIKKINALILLDFHYILTSFTIMVLNWSMKKFLLSCVLFLVSLVFDNCEYYKAYKYNEQGIQEFNETKLSDSKTSFHKSISYSYKSYIPIYNIGNTLMQEDDLPAAHEKFQQAIEANPEFREALYNDGQVLYHWGKKELSPETCNVERARVLWEQAANRFKETADLVNVGDYKKPSLDNAKFIEEEISKLEELEASKCQNQKDKSEEQEDKQDSDSGENEDDQKKQAQNNQSDNQDKPQNNKDRDKQNKDGDKGKDGKDSKDKNESKDTKDSKDKDKSGKDGKDSKDKDKSDKDGKDSKDKDKPGKDGKDSKDKDKSGKDGKDSKDKDKSGKDGKDSKDKDKSGKDGKDSKDKDKSGKDGKETGEDKNETGGNGFLPADDGGHRKPTLTPDEQKRIQKEMERVQKRSGETKNHKRSRHQQEKTNKDQEELEKGLREALW